MPKTLEQIQICRAGLADFAKPSTTDATTVNWTWHFLENKLGGSRGAQQIGRALVARLIRWAPPRRSVLYENSNLSPGYALQQVSRHRVQRTRTIQLAGGTSRGLVGTRQGTEMQWYA